MESVPKLDAHFPGKASGREGDGFGTLITAKRGFSFPRSICILPGSPRRGGRSQSIIGTSPQLGSPRGASAAATAASAYLYIRAASKGVSAA